MARFDRIEAGATESRSERNEDHLEGQVPCSMEERDWSCRVPSGEIHVQLRAEGFVPHYFWDRDLTLEEPLDLGEVALERGSSIVGWVLTEDEIPLGDSCRIEARPQIAGRAKPELQRKITSLSISKRVGGRGFFQISGLKPGAYELTATRDGYSPATRKSVIVTSNSETELKEDLLLQRPLDLVIQIHPSMDLSERAWRLQLMSSGFRTVKSGLADTEGVWEVAGVSSGRYRVWIANSSAQRMALEDIAVTRDTTRFDIELPITWVEGTVSLGDEPIPATIAFGGVSGAVSITMEADDEGDFVGWVPRRGDWRLDVQLADPPVFRRFSKVVVEPEDGSNVARIELKIPDTLIEGEAVKPDGVPVPDAQILISRFPAVDPPATATSEEDGRFALHGNDPGSYRLEARARSLAGQTLSSDPVDIYLPEDSSRVSTRLIMHKMTTLKGRIVSDGSGVPGASIRINDTTGPSIPPMISRKYRSDADGSFSVRLQDGLTQIELLVMAPGFVLKSFDLNPKANQEFTLPLEQHSGGEITINFNQEEESNDFLQRRPYMVKDGELQLTHYVLTHWARQNGSTGDATRMVLPNMPAGVYSVCWPYSEDSSVHEGDNVVDWRCDNKFLAPNHEAVFDPPGSDRAER